MPKRDKKTPAIFLDRDGTILNETGYLGDPKKMRFYRDVFRGLKILSQLGFPLVVVSNQSGLARGYFSKRDYARVNSAFLTVLKKRGVEIAAVYICPHLPTAECSCRKPRTGLLRLAARKLRIDVRKSFVIGDQLRDIELARNARATGILVLTGKGKYYRDGAAKLKSHVASNLSAAAKWIRQRIGDSK